MVLLCVRGETQQQAGHIAVILWWCFSTRFQLFLIFYPLRSMLKLCSSFIPAHTAGANSCIHLCRRTVSETETFRPFRWLLSSSVSLSLSMPLFVCFHFHRVFSPLFPYLLISISASYSLLLFFQHHYFSLSPLQSSLLSSLPLSFYNSLSLSGLRHSAVKRRQQSWWSANLLSFLRSIAVCVYIYVCVAQRRTQDRRLIRFPVTACDPKTMSEVRSIAGQVPAAEGRDDGWALEIIASSDNMAVQAGQGYCRMYSITDDSLLITE